MEHELKEQVQKRLKEGWVQSIFLIEVLAITGDAAKTALEKHVDKLTKEKGALVGRKDYKEVMEIKNPAPNVEKAYSYVVELEILAKNLDKLVYLAMNYGPSGIEILRPDKMTIDAGEAQNILTSVADMMHTFARLRGGGVLVNT